MHRACSLFFMAVAVFFLAASAHAFSGKVVRVIDGDTVEVQNSQGGEPITVRLYGVDTPEKEQAFGPEATSFTRDYALGKRVEVDTKGKDHYGRTIGVVSTGGRSLNSALVFSGHAWVYDEYCDSMVCKYWTGGEMTARLKGKGLWKNDHPVPPWKWRKRN